MAATSPQTTLNSGSCYACYGASIVEMLELAFLDSISQNIGSVVPPSYDGLLVYSRQGLPDTTEVNPVGARNLTFATNKVTAIHCHNCPLITSLTCTSNALLTTLDIVGCAALETLVFNNCTALPSVTLDSSFVTMTNINFESCSSLASFTANSVTTVSGSVNLRSLTGGTHFNITTFSMTALVSTGGSFFFYPGSGEAAQPSPASLSFPNLVSVGGYFIAAALTSLTSFSAPVIASVGFDFNVSNCDALTSLNANSLNTVGGVVYINGHNSLVTISLPVLDMAGDVNIYDNANAVTVSLPLLRITNSATFTLSNNLVSIDLTSLEECYSIYADGNADLASLSLPSLVNGYVPYEIFLNDCPSLVSFSVDIGSEAQEGSYYFYNSGLNQASVDRVFQFGANGGTTGAEYLCDGGTNSAPSVAGLANYNSLFALGNTVSKN